MQKTKPQKPSESGLGTVWGVFMAALSSMSLVNSLADWHTLPDSVTEILMWCGFAFASSVLCMICFSAFNPLLEQGSSRHPSYLNGEDSQPQVPLALWQLLAFFFLWFGLSGVFIAAVRYGISFVFGRPPLYSMTHYLLLALVLYACSALGVWMWFVFRERRSSHPSRPHI